MLVVAQVVEHLTVNENVGSASLLYHPYRELAQSGLERLSYK